VTDPTETQGRYCVNCKHSAPDQDGRYWCDALKSDRRKAPIICTFMRKNACQGGVLFKARNA